jgi:large subunit ribosomal protein L22
MEIKVTSKYLRISPRKLRLVVNSVRGKNSIVAKNILTFQPNKGSKMVLALLESALAIAKSNEVNQDNLSILSVVCSDGPRLKRGKPASKGSMMPITKRQSHLNLVLSDKIKEKSSDVEKLAIADKKTVEAKPNKSANKAKEENGTKG